MIAKEFEGFLLEQEETFLTPADQLAVLVDTHNADHAILLLSNMTYSRVPVVTADHHYVGTISLTDILNYQAQHGLAESVFQQTDIVHMTRKTGLTVKPDYTMTEVLHKLVDESFLPVVDDEGIFVGIITRKSILKAVNALLHDFGQAYEMKRK